MKITLKQLNTLILEALKEQDAAASGTEAQVQTVTAALQAIMNYAAAIYGGRRGYLPALGTRDRRQVNVLERSILEFGNTASTATDAVAPIDARTVPAVKRVLQQAQQEIRRMQGEVRSADLANLDLTAFGNRLRTLREQVIDGAYVPLAVLRNRLRGITSRPARPAPAPNPRDYINSLGTMVSSALSTPASSTPYTATPAAPAASDMPAADVLAAAENFSSTSERPAGEFAERTGPAPDTSFGALRPVPSPSPISEPPLEELPPRGRFRTLPEAALRHFIKQEVKKYLR